MPKQYKYVLEYDFTTFIDFKGCEFKSEWLEVFKDGTIKVKKGYAWDGCSPKFRFWGFLLGTPDGALGINMKPKTYYASLVHDALYQYKSEIDIPRSVADYKFKQDLASADWEHTELYYQAVRAFGGFYGKWKIKD